MRVKERFIKFLLWIGLLSDDYLIQLIDGRIK